MIRHLQPHRKSKVVEQINTNQGSYLQIIGKTILNVKEQSRSRYFQSLGLKIHKQSYESELKVECIPALCFARFLRLGIALIMELMILEP